MCRSASSTARRIRCVRPSTPGEANWKESGSITRRRSFPGCARETRTFSTCMTYTPRRSIEKWSTRDAWPTSPVPSGAMETCPLASCRNRTSSWFRSHLPTPTATAASDPAYSSPRPTARIPRSLSPRSTRISSGPAARTTSTSHRSTGCVMPSKQRGPCQWHRARTKRTWSPRSSARWLRRN